MTPAITTRRAADSQRLQRTSAFRDLHATRLFGFSLLLALGDRPTAARLTEAAIGDAASRLDDLRHPERAAAWLRHRVLRSANGRPWRIRPQERLAALKPLDTDAVVLAGLQALRLEERAALIASSVERFDDLDVGIVVGGQGARLHDLLRRARARYLAAAARVEPDARDGTPAGATTEAVRAVATRAMT